MAKYQLREISVVNTPTTKQFQVLVIASWLPEGTTYGYLSFGTSSEFQDIQNQLKVAVRNPEQVDSDAVGYFWPWTNSMFYVQPVDTGEETISLWVDYYWLIGDGTEVRVAESRLEFYLVAGTSPIHMEFNLLPENEQSIQVPSLSFTHSAPFIPVYAIDTQGNSYQYHSFYQQQPDYNLINVFWNKAESKQIELTIPECLFKTEPFPLPEGYTLGADCKVVAIVEKAS